MRGNRWRCSHRGCDPVPGPIIIRGALIMGSIIIIIIIITRDLDGSTTWRWMCGSWGQGWEWSCRMPTTTSALAATASMHLLSWPSGTRSSMNAFACKPTPTCLLSPVGGMPRERGTTSHHPSHHSHLFMITIVMLCELTCLSLVASIQFCRPDLLPSIASPALPIPLNPTPDYFAGNFLIYLGKK